MAKSSGAGGGAASNKIVRGGQRLGAPAMGIKPGWVDQLGNMRGDHVTDGRTVPARLTPMQGKTPAGGNQRLGNACTEPCGPKGEGRTLYGKSGTNQQYGEADRGMGRVAGTADVGSRAILGRPGQKV
jgi:hypothetical protein